MEKGISPGEFYNSSFSEWQSAWNAKAPEDRVQDPLELARSVGAI